MIDLVNLRFKLTKFEIQFDFFHIYCDLFFIYFKVNA